MATFAFCLVYVDDFMIAVDDSQFGQDIFQKVSNLYEWGTWESKSFVQCGAKITQAYDRRTQTWGGFEISFADYSQQLELLNLPVSRRREKMASITAGELTQLRGLLGQLQWLATQAVPQLMAPCRC